MKIRELSVYRAAYCGLCKTIGERYGLSTRLVLNYDCTFLALFLQTLTGEITCMQDKCYIRAHLKEYPVMKACAALEYAADVNVILSGCQMEDAWTDEKNIKALGGKVLLTAACRKAAERRPQAAKTVKDGLTKLARLEKDRAASIDLPACAFGEILSGIVMQYPFIPKVSGEAIRWMFFNLGRWIYLIDAWDDRKKDEKSGSYNPFLLCGIDAEEAAFQLYTSLTEMECAYDSIAFTGNASILDNIVHLGCREKTKELLNKQEGNTEKNESV